MICIGYNNNNAIGNMGNWRRIVKKKLSGIVQQVSRNRIVFHPENWYFEPKNAMAHGLPETG
jgi:hypothetical protein